MSVQEITENAIRAAYGGTPDEWKAEAHQILTDVCSRHSDFTTGDLWDAGLPPLAENRGVGGVLRRGANAGLCRKTDRTIRLAVGPARHVTDVRIWESLTYGEED